MAFRRNRHFRTAIAAVALTTVAGLALAQQPFFRFNMSGGGPNTTPSGPQVPVPKPQPNNDGKLDFGSGNTAPFTLRALVGEPVSLEFGTIGGTNPITWLTAPALPAGLNYADGVIHGTPSAPADGTQTFGAQDAGGRQAQARVTFDIYNAAVSLHQFKPVIRVGSAYEGFVASNVAMPTYVVSGLPGASIASPGTDSRASFAGVASTPGTFPFTVSVSRPGTSIAAQASQQVRIADPLAIAFEPSVVPPLSGPMSVAATARNVVGTAPLQVVGQTAGLQARGLTYSNGTLSGTLGVGPATSLTLRAIDSADAAQVEATLPIPEILATQASIVIGESRPGDAFKAATGSAVPATIQTQIPSPICTVTQPVPGLQVSSNCTITGAATSPGAHTLTVSIVPASNPQAAPVVASAPVIVHPTLAASPSQAHSTPGPGAEIHLTVNTSGVVGTPSFELVGVTPAQLEAVGLSFDPATGAISGPVDPETSISPQVRLTDSKDGKATVVTFTIVSGPATVTTGVSSMNYRGGDVRTFQASTNIPNPTYSLVDAPEYVSIDPQSGLITITAPEVSTLTTIPGYAVRAEKADRPAIFKQTTVSNPGVIRQKLVLTVASTASVRGNVVLDLPFTTSGATSPTVTLAPGGALPVGVTVGANSISGKPTVPGVYPVTLRLTDGADGRQEDRQVEITVTPSLDFTLTSAVSPVGKGYVGSPYSVTVQTANVLGTVVFENVVISGRPILLANGSLTIDPATGAITGNPQSAFNGVANIRMTETHEGKTTIIEKPLTLSINAPVTASTTIPTVTFNGNDVTAQVYDTTAANTSVLLGTGSALTYTFPDDVTVNGLIGNPAYSFTVRNETTGQSFTASNNANFTASTSRVWTVTMNSTNVNMDTLRLAYNGATPVAPRIVPPAAAGYLEGSPVNIALASADTVGAVTWSATGLPSTIQINPTTGAITGTLPTDGSSIGNHNVVVSLTDSRGVAAFPRPIPMSVHSHVTARTELPAITGLGDTALLAKLYDIDQYDVNNADGTSQVTIPAGGQLTYTYARAVTVNQLEGAYASGSVGGVIRIDDAEKGTSLATLNAFGGSMAGTFTGKTFTLTNTSPNPIRMARLALSYQGAAPYLVMVNEQIVRSINNGTAASTALRGRQIFDVGTTLSLTPGASYQEGSVTWSVTGTLPRGLNFDDATGRIFGTLEETGTSTVWLSVRDARGIQSVAKPIAFTVDPSASAQTTVPQVSGLGDPSLLRAALMDYNQYEVSNAGGESFVTLPANGIVTFTYPTPVKANYVFFQFASGEAAGNLLVRNESLGSQIYQGSGSGYFTAVNSSNTSVGTVYTVQNTSGRSLRIANMAISWAGNFPNFPSFTPSSVRIRYTPTGNYSAYSVATKVFWAQGTYYDVILDPSNTQSPAVWSVVSGTLPNGVDIDPATGRIWGTPTVPGEYSFTVATLDALGRNSVPRTINVRVMTNQTAANTMPELSGVADPDLARSAWYDGWDSDGPSRYVLPAGATVTFTYPNVVRANSLSVTYAPGSPVASLVVRNETTNAQVYSSTSTGTFQSIGGTPDSEGSVFSVRNSGTQALNLSEFYIGLGYNRVATPYIQHNYSQIRYAPTGNYSNFGSLTAGQIIWTQGSYYDLITAQGQGQAPAVWSIASGTRPPGIEIDPATGRLYGTPNAPGTYAFSITVTDARGYRAVPVPLTIRVLTSQTVANVLPEITGVADPAFARKAWYDAASFETTTGNDTGPSRYVLPAGATATFTYPVTVRANRFVAEYASGFQAQPLVVRNETTNQQLYSGTSYSTFTAYNGTSESEGTVFTIRNAGTGPANLANLYITGNGGFVTLPSIYGNSYRSRGSVGASYTTVSNPLSTKFVVTQGAYFDVQIDTQSATAPATLSVVSGNKPSDLTLEPGGRLWSNSLNTPGDYSFTVAVTDGRGYQSVPFPVNIRVTTNRTASTTLPTITGSGVSDSAAALTALYDIDSYDTGAADGNSKITLPTNGTLTFTYPETVALNYVQKQVALNGNNGNIEIRNETTNQVLYTGAGTGNYFNTIDNTSLSEGTVFTVRNTSGSPTTIANLRLMTHGASLTVPYIPESVYIAVNNGVENSATLRTRHVFIAGTNYRWLVASAGGTGTGYTVTFDSAPPPGMSLHASGGFTGVPTTPGDYNGTFTVTDSAGRTSVSKPYRITVLPAELAYNTIPTVTGIGGSDASARLHDSNTTSASSVTMAAGATATFTFPTAVRADGFGFGSASNGSFEVRNEAGTVVYSGSNQAPGNKTFSGGLDNTSLTYGTTFTIRNTGATAIELHTMRILMSGSGFIWPTITQPTAAQTTFARTGLVSYSFSGGSAAGALSWTATGSLPQYFDLVANNGYLYRPAATPNTAADSKTVTINLTDGRGLAAIPITVTITVN